MICKSALSRNPRFHPNTEGGGDLDKCSLFRPLYQNLSGSGTAGNNDKASADIAINEAKEKAFQKGLQSGQAEARSMRKASLSPMFKAFVNSYHDLSTLEEKIRTQTCVNIAELGLAIAERILGEPADIDAKHLQIILQNGMAEANGLCLNIHPNDLQALRTIMADSGLAWTSRMDLLLKANAAVQPGEIRVEDPTALMDVGILQALTGHFNPSASPASDHEVDLASTK